MGVNMALAPADRRSGVLCRAGEVKVVAAAYLARPGSALAGVLCIMQHG